MLKFQEPKIKPKLTLPQPFNLSQGRKRKSDSTTTEPVKASERFKSVAEQVQNFARKTPDRFRTSRRSGEWLNYHFEDLNPDLKIM